MTEDRLVRAFVLIEREFGTGLRRRAAHAARLAVARTMLAAAERRETRKAPFKIGSKPSSRACKDGHDDSCRR